MFDVAVFAPWPRGGLLARKLSERGKKVCRIELSGGRASPFACFVDERQGEEKAFLESIGFLFRQEGGFCLLSNEGNWPFQEIAQEKRGAEGLHPIFDRLLREKAAAARGTGWREDSREGDSQKKFRWRRELVKKNRAKRGKYAADFQNFWPSFLAGNLCSRIFEDNISLFSSDPLNFFADCFLFEPSLKKKRLFQQRHSDIFWEKASVSDLKYQEGQKGEGLFFLRGERLQSRKFFWLGELFEAKGVLSSKKPLPSPEWEWACFEFAGDLGSYEDIVPEHFVSLGHVALPWTHDNLLSVFRKKGLWEVWLRKPFRGGGGEDLGELAAAHLSRRFPGLRLKKLARGKSGREEAKLEEEKRGGAKAAKTNSGPEEGSGGNGAAKPKKGFLIYGPDSLKSRARTLKNVLFEDLRESPQWDIMSQLREESRLSQML